MLRWSQLHDQNKAIFERRREIEGQRHRKLEALGAFDEAGQMIEELLDDEARQLSAELGRLTRQHLDLSLEARAHSEIHRNMLVHYYKIIFANTFNFFPLKVEKSEKLAFSKLFVSYYFLPINAHLIFLIDISISLEHRSTC